MAQRTGELQYVKKSDLVRAVAENRVIMPENLIKKLKELPDNIFVSVNFTINSPPNVTSFEPVKNDNVAEHIRNKIISEGLNNKKLDEVFSSFN